MKNLKLIISLISFFVIITQAFSQESLQAKYDNLLENTETFQQYKVIPRTSLNAFWSETTDSLSLAKSQIRDLKSNVSTQKDSIQSLNVSVSGLQSSLDESLNMNDSISLLGISFSKLGYHILVWSIIIALAVLGIFAYLLFLRSNGQTSRFRRDMESLRSEFEAHKEAALAKQLKLKRELQTAINQLSEKR